LLREQQGYWTRAKFYLEGHFARALCPLALHAGAGVVIGAGINVVHAHNTSNLESFVV
jgi:hypothetical protein